MTLKRLKINYKNPDDRVLYYVAEALRQGMPVEQIYKLSAIDPWFIEKIENIVKTEKKLKDQHLTTSCYVKQRNLDFLTNRLEGLLEKMILILEK